MANPKSTFVILNASAGFRAKTDLPAMLERALDNPTICNIQHGMDARKIAADAIRDGAEIVVAAGGDGTINAVASAVAGTSAALGVIPAGTLNHFARDLRIPIDLEAAVGIIATGRTVAVDIGEVNGRRFINNAIIGLYPAYRFQRDRAERRGRYRWLAISSALINVFRRNPALHVTLEADGRIVERKTPFLMVANNLHEMEGYRLGNRRSLTEGRLWSYVMHRMSRARLLRLGLSILLGRFSKWRDFDVVGSRELSVTSKRRHIGVSLDGEVVRMSTPLEYRSLPGALRVIVPAQFPG